MMMRLWEQSSRARSSSAGTRSRCRRTGTRRSPAYQSGREFDASLLEQLAMLPELCAALALRGRQGAGLRGGRLPRRGASRRGGARRHGARRERRPRHVPARERRDDDPLARFEGVSEIARIGPAEVRERYGVEPAAGAGLHRAARRPVGQASRREGRRPEDGAASLLAQYGRSRRCSRTAASRRRRTSCASTGASRDGRGGAAPGRARRASPTGPAAPSSSGRWGLNAARGAARRESAVDVAQPRAARGAPSDRRPPRAAGAARGAARRRSPTGVRAARRPRRRSCAATRAEHLEHAPRDRRGRRGSTPTRPPRRRATRRRCSRRARRSRRRAATRSRSSVRPGITRRVRHAMGFCLLQQRRDRGARRAGRRRRARRDRRLRRAPRQRDAGHLLGRRHRLLRVAAPVAVLPRHRRARRSSARRRSTCRCRPGLGRRRVPRTPSTTASLRRSSAFEPELVLVSAGFDAHEDEALLAG